MTLTKRNPASAPVSPETRAALASMGVMPAFVDAAGDVRHVPDTTLAALAARFVPAMAAAGTAAATHAATDGTDARMLPEAPRGWGYAVQLYAARRPTSWGIGDFSDLAWLMDRALVEGSACVLVSPLHATHPVAPQDSPYSPASREWLNLLHVDVEHIPGAGLVYLGDLVDAGRALNRDRIIDRAAVWKLKRTGLARVWNAVSSRTLPETYHAFVAEGGESLRQFAIWSALAAELPGPWWNWPAKYQHPDSPAVAAFAAEHADQIAFWSWCQWVADLQLAAAAAGPVDLVLDLAVGFDSGGCDGWSHQDLLCFDFEVGCPPDLRNLEGQRWGLPPYVPTSLAAAGYAPWRRTIRSALRHAKGLRIDHVMALWRLFWVPAGGSPADGAYVTYPVDAMLTVLAEEAQARGAWVVGEDMGTVPDGVRETMAAIGMLGYRVSTRVAPETFPSAVMAAAETHDQPTLAGIVTGEDVAACLRVGKRVDEVGMARLRRDVLARARTARLGDDGDRLVGDGELLDVVAGNYDALASSPARLVLLTVDDAGCVVERPNIPGAPAGYPCWNLALPVPVDTLLASSSAQVVVDAIAAGRQRVGMPFPLEPVSGAHADD